MTGATGPTPTDGTGLLKATIPLPYRITAEFTQTLWDACELLPVTQYLQQYRPYLDWGRIAELRRIGFSFGGLRQIYQRICIEGSTESVLLAPAYPVVARINRLLGRGNSHY